MNTEARRAARKRWAAANPEKVRAAARRWAAANPEKKRAWDKRWAAANPEKARRKGREWMRKKRAKLRQEKRMQLIDVSSMQWTAPASETSKKRELLSHLAGIVWQAEKLAPDSRSTLPTVNLHGKIVRFDDAGQPVPFYDPRDDGGFWEALEIELLLCGR